MALKVRQLILTSLRMTGEYDPNERPDGEYFDEYLDHLNLKIDEFNAGGQYLPFIEKLPFTIEANKDTYLFSEDTHADVNSPKLIKLSYANIFFVKIFHPLRILTKAEYYYIYRTFALKRRPTGILLEQEPNGSTIKVYPIPDQNYECNLGAKIALPQYAINDDLSNLPPYYQRFLTYTLGRIMVDIFKSGEWSARQELDYQELKKIVVLSNEEDYDLKLSSALLGRPSRYPYYYYFFPYYV